MRASRSDLCPRAASPSKFPYTRFTGQVGRARSVWCGRRLARTQGPPHHPATARIPTLAGDRLFWPPDSIGWLGPILAGYDLAMASRDRGMPTEDKLVDSSPCGLRIKMAEPSRTSAHDIGLAKGHRPSEAERRRFTPTVDWRSPLQVSQMRRLFHRLHHFLTEIGSTPAVGPA
jgi:hypothetical protein